MAALLALAATAACSHAAAPPAPPPPAASASGAGGQPPAPPQTLPGSYIVQAPGNGEQAIRQIFGEYGVALVRPLGNGQFEMRLSRDPGLDVLQRQIAESRGAVTAVQPNFIYRIQ